MLKDESAHPTGSLKHRLAHALVHAIASGEVGPDTGIVEASSGSTAISEAWFARALGRRFVAVVPPHGVEPAGKKGGVQDA
jgi:cysteine synthase A